MSGPQMQCRLEKVATMQVGEIKTEWVPFSRLKVPDLNHDEMLAKAAKSVGEYIAQEFEDVVTGTIEGEVVE